MLQFILENWQSIATYLLGGGGIGFLFFKQDKQAKIIANISSATDEWKKFVDELKQENKDLKDYRTTLEAERSSLYERLNKSMEDAVDAAYYKGLYHSSRCDVWGCKNRRPPLKNEQIPSDPNDN